MKYRCQCYCCLDYLLVKIVTLLKSQLVRWVMVALVNQVDLGLQHHSNVLVLEHFDAIAKVVFAQNALKRCLGHSYYHFAKGKMPP